MVTRASQANRCSVGLTNFVPPDQVVIDTNVLMSGILDTGLGLRRYAGPSLPRAEIGHPGRELTRE